MAARTRSSARSAPARARARSSSVRRARATSRRSANWCAATRERFSASLFWDDIVKNSAAWNTLAWFATLVALAGFFGLVLVGFLTYQSSPPIPGRVATAGGQQLFTGADIRAGQDVFLRNGLMEYGSIFGHGAYLGPDYTADYLHRSAQIVTDQYGGPGSDIAQGKTRHDFKTNHYDSATKTLTVSDAQGVAFSKLVDYYAAQFAKPGKTGLRPHAITSRTDIEHLTSYFAWTSWAASADRPGKNYSYTNNWPPEPLVGNGPTADTVVWSVLSLIALLGGTGAVFAAFGRFGLLGGTLRAFGVQLPFTQAAVASIPTSPSCRTRCRCSTARSATEWIFTTRSRSG